MALTQVKSQLMSASEIDRTLVRLVSHTSDERRQVRQPRDVWRRFDVGINNDWLFDHYLFGVRVPSGSGHRRHGCRATGYVGKRA